MKSIIILVFALIVGASAFAQKSTKLPADTIKKTAVKDTLYHISLDKAGLQVLFEALQNFGPLVRRSPDLTALQADEAIKGITAFTEKIYKQIKPPLPPAKDKNAEPPAK